MAFTITLYKNSAEPERIDKTAYLATALRLDGTLKEETDISTPSILFEYSGTLPAFNYVHIPAFRRYYFLTRLVSVSTNLWRMDLSCDVLQSFQNEIKSNSATLARAESCYNNEIKDSMLPFTSERLYTKIDLDNASSVLDPAGTPYLYLLITANGAQHYGSDLVTTYPTPINSANSYYIMTAAQINEVLGLIWAETSQAGAQYLFDSLGEAVVAIKGFPFDLKAMGRYDPDALPAFNTIEPVTSIRIGNITLNLSAGSTVYQLKGNYIAQADLGSFTVGNRDSFREFSPYTSYSLYLPYIGFVDISPEQYAGIPIRVNYKIDLDTGKVLATLFSSQLGALYNAVFATYSGMIGGNIPISNSGADAFDAQVFRTVTGATTGALLAPLAAGAGSGGPVLSGGMLGSLISAGVNAGLNMERTVRAEGTSTPFIDVHQPAIPFLIRSSAVSAEPADYGRLYGRPSMLTMSLGDVSGFAMIDRVHLENLDEATEGEINEISRLLHSGVIF